MSRRTTPSDGISREIVHSSLTQSYLGYYGLYRLNSLDSLQLCMLFTVDSCALERLCVCQSTECEDASSRATCGDSTAHCAFPVQTVLICEAHVSDFSLLHENVI